MLPHVGTPKTIALDKTNNWKFIGQLSSNDNAFKNRGDQSNKTHRKKIHIFINMA